ncbi:MAG TPA: 23S rRNA (uridine(2552)-2'-O)-methyltransferase RlmE [Candidatus Competibacteraceae bacterium]|nr:23S rRNA (uridine(2552)-2'-O)-methyltransferase RlmE [Candidatus Competibacteraceae bacterium]
MARSKSSARWLKEHFEDEYVKRAQREGYRSRAVYKLKEIQEKDRLLRPGMTVVDLGAAPGGWAQYVAEVVGDKGWVVALDILPLEPLPGVEFIQGDFREQAVLDQLLAVLEGRPVDLVISDMAPNTSGIRAVDQPKGMYLVELALDFARQTLRPGGDFLAKVFQGEGFDALLRELRTSFATVAIRKPRASRARSPELYLLARNHRL